MRILIIAIIICLSVIRTANAEVEQTETETIDNTILTRRLVSERPWLGEITDSYSKEQRKADFKEGYSDGWKETGAQIKENRSSIPGFKPIHLLFRTPILFKEDSSAFHVRRKRQLLIGGGLGAFYGTVGGMTAGFGFIFGFPAMIFYDAVYLAIPPKIEVQDTGNKTYDTAWRMGARNRIRLQRTGALVGPNAIVGFAGGVALGIGLYSLF